MFCVGCGRGKPACTEMGETACAKTEEGVPRVREKRVKKTIQKQFTCMMKRSKTVS